MRGFKEDGIRLFSVISTERTRGNEHKLKYKKFNLNLRKNIFTVRMVEHWSRFPRETVESAFLEQFENPAGYGPEQLAVSDPALSTGGGLGDLQRPRPTSTEFL